MGEPYERYVGFSDLDGVGFVFFANYLVLCHEAYEADLRRVGIELRSLFLSEKLLIPISKSQVQYLAPLVGGSRVRVEVARTRLTDASFRVDYRLIQVAQPEKVAGLAQTEHVAVDLETFQRRPLPPAMLQWLAGAG